MFMQYQQYNKLKSDSKGVMAIDGETGFKSS
jgi:hypothetical protein